MSKIKTCIVCGKKYEYCGHCDKGGQETRWKVNYCSENCRDIFDIISKYANNHISIDEAKEKLVGKDLGINIKNSIAKYCGEIITHGEATEDITEKVVEDNIEETIEEPVEKVDEEITEETVEEATENIAEETTETSNETPSLFSKSELKSKRRRRYIPTSK